MKTASLIVRRSILLLLVPGLAGCAIFRVEGQRPERVEQFAFESQEGTGPGAAADAALADLFTDPGNPPIPGSADHLGSVAIANDTIEFYSWRQIDQLSGDEVICSGNFSEGTSAIGCGGRGAPVDTVISGGVSSDGEWAESALNVSSEVASIMSVAVDGTTYVSTPVNGFAYVAWPLRRGDLQATAYDASGQPLDTITLSGGFAAESSLAPESS